MNKILLVGHVTYDFRGGERLKGGPPLFMAEYLDYRGLDYDVITSCDNDFPRKDNWFVIPSEVTTTFEFRHGDVERQLLLRARASDLHLDDIKGPYSAIVVSPVAGEVGAGLISELRKITELLVVDVQGFVRIWDDVGRIFLHSRKDLGNILKEADVIKASSVESNLITDNPEGTLLITSEDGVEFVSGGLSKFIPVDECVTPVDDTGAGDVFLAAFISSYLETNDMIEAVRQGSSAAAISIRCKGVPPASFYSSL